MDEVFTCAFCFESNSTFVDPSGGRYQSYVEDCQVCCRPNLLKLSWDDSQECFFIESEPES